jgi:hypothetical protein
MALTEITKIDADWKDVKNECRNTVNKEYSDKPATSKFKKMILIAEHSPITLVSVKWRWKQIMYFVSTHFARHWLGWDKWISTQRTDRTGVDRNNLPQDAPVNYDGRANAMALINVSRKRLCFCASPETRQYMEDLKCEIHKREEELADVLVPNCVYRCGCPEPSACGYWKKFVERHSDEDLFTISNRYDLYNKDFYKLKGVNNENRED